MKRVLLSLAVIGTVGVAAFNLSSAFFSDTETSSDNTFTAGSLDLKINSLDNPSAIVSVDDLKPGDDVIEEKILKVIDNPANVWMHIKDLTASQSAQTEPEEDEESETGERWDIENFLTYDLIIDGDALVATESAVPFTDIVSCWIPLGVLPGNTEVSVEQSFHFDEGVTDWAQGDTLEFTEEFYASQVADPSDPPDTGSGRSWDETEKKCLLPEEDPGDPYADEVTVLTGTVGTPTSLSSSIAVVEPLVVGAPDSDFIQISDGTAITLKFVDNKAVDGPGFDIEIHIFDVLFPALATIEISDDGVSWVSIGSRVDTSNAFINLTATGLTEVLYVRLTDLVAVGDPYPALGFDLDAVEALNSVAVP